MAANKQFMTTRMTNASAGNLVDDSFVDLEAAIANAFGFTLDTPISQVMTISSAGNVTMVGDLTLSGAPTNALHCATKKYIDDNAVSWTQYLVQASDGSGLHNLTIDAGTDADLNYYATPDWEIGSADQFDAGANDDRLVCKAAGFYLIYARVGVTNSGGSDIRYELKHNGISYCGGVMGGYWESSNKYWGSFAIVIQLALNDYLELHAYNPEADGHSWTGEWGEFGMMFLRGV
jgi:hypothetical protein